MVQAWTYMSLLSAFALATSDALTKRALEHGNEYLIAWFRLLFSLPLLFIVGLYIPRPQIDHEFYSAFIVALPLEVIALVLYIKALKISPLSLTLPFLSITPVLIILMSFFLLGEKISFQGGIGILLIAIGSYTLHLHKVKEGILAPLKSLIREKGSLLMICVAMIYSITAPLGKVAIQHSSALFFGITYFTVLTLIFTPIALWVGKNDLKFFITKKKYSGLIAPGLFNSVMIIFHMMAISLVQVAYMISVKRISLLIGLLYGYFLFRETHIKERFLGGLLMLTGFVLIVTT